MHTQQISIHDRYQLEIKTSFMPEAQRPTRYYMETYFYLPGSLNVNRRTYSKANFYHDSRSYIRLQTPPIPLAELAKHPLFNSLLQAWQNPLAQNDQPERFRIKLLAGIIRSSVRDFSRHFNRKRGINAEDHINIYVTCVNQLLQTLRQSSPVAPHLLPPGSVLRLADEFISLNAERFAFRIYRRARKLAPQANKQLFELINKEDKYRRTCGYRAVLNPEGDNEKFAYRSSLLKKFFAGALFLRSKTDRSSQYLEQFLFSLAAGIAMVFATVIAFYGRSRFGDATPALFLLLVVSYMLKDRIKEMFRYYFHSRLSRKIFDYNQWLTDADADKVGYCKEGFDFVPERFDKEVAAVRAKNTFGERNDVWRPEDVLLYRKKISIVPKNLTRSGIRLTGLIDIFRFNVAELLRQMDDPREYYHVCTGNECKTVQGVHNYYFHMIVRFVEDDKKTIRHWRVAVNRKGIVRLEDPDGGVIAHMKEALPTVTSGKAKSI